MNSDPEGASQVQGTEYEDSSIDSEDEAEFKNLCPSAWATDDTSDKGSSVAPSPDRTGQSEAIWCGPVNKGKRVTRKRDKDVSEDEKLWENMEHNSGYPRDKRVIPHPVIITVYINGKACRALVDTGAFADFISTSAVESLGLKKEVLAAPIPLQMAVQGSRSRINTAVRYNPGHALYVAALCDGGNEPNSYCLLSAMMIHEAEELEKVREMLRAEGRDLCEDTALAALPPFRAINHHIPLIEESKKYRYRPSKCPKALQPQWREKCQEYINNGRWRLATKGENPIPLLLIAKPRKSPNDPICLISQRCSTELPATSIDR